ncbi:MAG: hypothetical protein EOO54_20300, partial [Haliea sp.]
MHTFRSIGQLPRFARFWSGAFLVAALAACGGGGGGDEVVTPPPPPPVAAPVIVQQPVGQSVVSGGTAGFSVGVQDATGVSYQWLRGGTEVPGATQPSYTFTAALGDAGSRWSVRVSNPGGTVTSSDAVLDVTPRSAAETPVGISLFAGDIGGAGTADGTGAQARFNSPRSLVLGADGAAYVVDRVGPDYALYVGAQVRKVTAAGAVSGYLGAAGTGTLDGSAAVAQFTTIRAIASDRPRKLLYLMDGDRIRRVAADGQVSTVPGVSFAGTQGGAVAVVAPDGTLFYTGGKANNGLSCCAQTAIYRLPLGSTTSSLFAGAENPPTINPQLEEYRSLTADNAGNLYGSVLWSVRKIDAQGSVSVLAGSAAEAGF